MFMKSALAAATASVLLQAVSGDVLKNDIGEAVAHAVGAVSAQQSSTPSASNSSSSACAQLSADYASYVEANPSVTRLANVPLSAKRAYDCALSVPFVPAHALELLATAKEYWQFQTTLSYLKDPTPAYQQPPVDVMKTLDAIIANVKSGSYGSQYEFDYNIYLLVAATHEEHFNLDVGVIGLFSWNLDQQLIAASSDGNALPKVYNYNDILNTGNSNASYAPSAVETIEGRNVLDYLSDLAAKTQIGDIEPHADFNVLMANPAFSFDVGGVIGYHSAFQGGKIYRGESVKGTFENGTSFEWPFHASATESLIHGFSSGQDIYNNYVLQPTSTPTASTSAPASSTATPSGVAAIPSPNYPRNPVVVQEQFGFGGTVSGYLLDDVKVGVLSLPSFETGDENPSATTFSAAVASFIEKAKNAGMAKIVIDIQGNGGGSVFQGYDTFAQFFPATYPYLQNRIRAQRTGNTIGSIITAVSANVDGAFNQSTVDSTTQGYAGAPSFDAASDLTENGDRFASWQEFYGPISFHGDAFSHSARYNLSDPNQTFAGFGEFVYGFANNSATTPQPWAAEDIILLSDGQCGSTCSIFAELMKTNAGVKSVAVGGLPEYGPMQTVSGTRGSNVLKWADVSSSIQGVTQILAFLTPAALSKLLQTLNLTEDDLKALPSPIDNLKYNIRGARYNALDVVRPGSNDPLQFTYQAADCRLFFTAPMHRDITVLWKAAAAFLGGDCSICVPGSTGHPTAQPNVTSTSAPASLPCLPGYNGTGSYNGTAAYDNCTTSPPGSLSSASPAGQSASPSATVHIATGGAATAGGLFGGIGAISLVATVVGAMFL